MAIAGSIAGSIAASIVGVNTDPQQPNAGGGGGGGYTPWDLTTLTSANDSNVDTTGTQNVAAGVWWKPDGSKIFFVGREPKSLQSYAVPTAWDLSSIVAAAETSGLVLVDFTPYGLWMSSDGTSVCWCGWSTDTIKQGVLSTPWDVTTLGSITSYDMTADGVTAPIEVRFNSDGTKMYVQELPANYKISQFDLGTAYDVTTAVFVDEYDYATDTSSDYSNGFWINGNEIYLNGQGSKIWKFTWDGSDITTMSYDSNQAYANTDAGEGGLWMDDERICYFTTIADKFWVHLWGPHA